MNDKLNPKLHHHGQFTLRHKNLINHVLNYNYQAMMMEYFNI